MDCEKCADDLSAYLDGELSTDRAHQVRSHIGICKSCAEELRGLQETELFVESHAGELAPSDETWNLVRMRIATMEPAAPSSFYFPIPVLNRWRTVTAMLVAAATLTLGLWSFMRHQEAQRSLDVYMNQYISAREAQEQSHRFIITNSESDPQADNPFVEVKSTSASNPLLSEDQ